MSVRATVIYSKGVELTELVLMPLLPLADRVSMLPAVPEAVQGPTKDKSLLIEKILPPVPVYIKSLNLV